MSQIRCHPPSRSTSIWRAGFSEADRALGESAGIARTLPNPHLLVGPFVGPEAVLSSRIEGIQASLSDLLFFEAANLREREVPDVREVANYVNALEYGLSRLAELPLSLRFIREMHERLLESTRGEHLSPGEFRRSQNWIGPAGCTLMDATCVSPPVREIDEALDAFEKLLHAESRLPPLVRLALIHYQFEAIHPFLDGNGRIGRLLIALLLCTEKLLPQPLLYLSAYFERHRDEYYGHLLSFHALRAPMGTKPRRFLGSVSQDGSWGTWIRFFLRAIAVQARDAIRRSDLLFSLWQRYRQELQQARASALLLGILVSRK